MAESKARGLLQDLAATGALPELPAGLPAPLLAQVARDQGVAGLLLAAVERDRPAWAAGIEASLASMAKKASDPHSAWVWVVRKR